MKWLLIIAGVIVALTLSLSLFLQPNDMSLCPWNQGQPTTRQGCQAADAIVAISGGDTQARTAHAVSLYQNGWAPYIIFSGAARDKSGPSNAQAMRAQAIEVGVPASAILIEELSENTEQNASKTRELLVARDINDVILVTSGYHQRRASLEFNRSVADQPIAIRNSPTNDRDWGWWWWATPRGWYLATTEFGKIVVFYAGGTSS